MHFFALPSSDITQHFCAQLIQTTNHASFFLQTAEMYQLSHEEATSIADLGQLTKVDFS